MTILVTLDCRRREYAQTRACGRLALIATIASHGNTGLSVARSSSLATAATIKS